jgi:hypothetical protein
MTHVLDQATGRDWMLYQGDCVQVAPGYPERLGASVSVQPAIQLNLHLQRQ